MDRELLREWLIRTLEPLCDADPEVLSKYVLALVQNDPKKEGLQEICVTKLEEFLGDETKGFVTRLFKTIESGSYKSTHEEGEEVDNSDYIHNNHQHSYPNRGDSRPDRRRGRTASDDEDDYRRFNKRRRDDDRSSRDDRYDGRRLSPRGDAGNNRRQPFPRGAPAGNGVPGPHMGGGRGGGYGGGMDRRRNFPPEWGMPPPQHMGGMWPFPPRGAFPGPHPMGDFDPNAPFTPDAAGMVGPPPPHQMNMMRPRHMGGQFYPPPGGRGRGGRGGGHYAGRGGEPSKDEEGGGENAHVHGAKTTLRVSNVDPKYVNMTKLSLHFSKFGNVVNVQMRPNFKCAYVQYATEEEAKKAFHSPIPVCNNRFIEVKWAKYDAKDPQGAPSIAEQSAAELKENDEGGNTGEVTSTLSTAKDDDTAASIPEREMTPEELRAAALEKGRKVLEEKRELLEKQKQLMKQKEELIKRQLAQQKEMLERMSRNSAQFSVADKRDLLNKITALSEELKALQPRSNTQYPASTEPGSHLNGLKAELSALEAQASHQGGRGGRTGGRWSAAGRGYGRGNGRGGRGGRGAFVHHSHTLDNRTTIVKVDNLPVEARDPSVLEQHFGNFGAIEQVVFDEATPGQGYIKFQDRYAGQAALSHGSMFGDTKLQMTWVESQEAPTLLQQSATTPTHVAATAPTPVSDSNEVSANA